MWIYASYKISLYFFICVQLVFVIYCILLLCCWFSFCKSYLSNSQSLNRVVSTAVMLENGQIKEQWFEGLQDTKSVKMLAEAHIHIHHLGSIWIFLFNPNFFGNVTIKLGLNLFFSFQIQQKTWLLKLFRYVDNWVILRPVFRTPFHLQCQICQHICFFSAQCRF